VALSKNRLPIKPAEKNHPFFPWKLPFFRKGHPTNGVIKRWQWNIPHKWRLQWEYIIYMIYIYIYIMYMYITITIYIYIYVYNYIYIYINTYKHKQAIFYCYLWWHRRVSPVFRYTKKTAHSKQSSRFCTWLSIGWGGLPKHNNKLLWLVVSSPVKNISQFGLWNSQYMEK